MKNWLVVIFVSIYLSACGTRYVPPNEGEPFAILTSRSATGFIYTFYEDGCVSSFSYLKREDVKNRIHPNVPAYIKLSKDNFGSCADAWFSFIPKPGATYSLHAVTKDMNIEKDDRDINIEKDYCSIHIPFYDHNMFDRGYKICTITVYGMQQNGREIPIKLDTFTPQKQSTCK
jgi:hypothetical protein